MNTLWLTACITSRDPPTDIIAFAASSLRGSLE
jgi:hypothetical protein